MTATVRIATRASELARWQAEHVASLLGGVDPTLGIEMVPVSTEGDRRTDVPLSSIGGKGVFSKEIQRAVLDGRADVAVHSAKDLPALTPDGLVIAAVPPRADPRDALVGSDIGGLAAAVAAGTDAVVATGSARRRVQLADLVPGLHFAELRGNMGTRIERARDFDAVVVAAAALERLGLTEHISQVLPADVLVPQVGQGALAVECRAGDDELRGLLRGIEDARSRLAVDAERGFLAELGGDCSLPAGAHCILAPVADSHGHGTGDGPQRPVSGAMVIEGILGETVEPGTRTVRDSLRADIGSVDPEALGRDLAVGLRTLLEDP